jgi:hypothetical protein
MYSLALNDGDVDFDVVNGVVIAHTSGKSDYKYTGDKWNSGDWILV